MASEQISVMEADTKELQASGSIKNSIKISDDSSDKLANESIKDSSNEKTDATEPKEILRGGFGYSVPRSGVSIDQSRESEYEYDNFVNTQQLKSWVLHQIESADTIRFFERKYIRKIVTDLGGDVLKVFVDKLRQLKKQEE